MSTRPSQSALIIAAHGAHEGSSANAFVRNGAETITRRGWFDEVSPAFRLGDPTFATVLDRIRADDVTVVPMMTSRGYYCDEVLPRELQRNHRFNEVRLVLTPPVGTRVELVEAAGQRIKRLLATYRIHSEDTSVVVVGHGTARHAASRDATIRFALGVEAIQSCDDVRPSFLDDEPSFEGVVQSVSRPSVLVVPFLIGGGYHASGDICDRLGLTPACDERQPHAGHVNGRFLVLDIPVGFYPEIVNVIADLARPHVVATAELGAIEVSS